MWYFCEGVRGSKLRIIMLFVDTFRGIGLWMKADIARGWANRSSAAIIYRRQGHFNGFHEIEVFDFTIIINFFGLTPLLTISRLFHLYLPPIALITIRINSSPALPKSWQGNNFEPHILHNLFISFSCVPRHLFRSLSILGTKYNSCRCTWMSFGAAALV